MPLKSSLISKYLFLLTITVAILAPLGFLYAVDPPTASAARTYVPLAPLPEPPIGSGIIADADTDLAKYLKKLFWFAIVSAGVLAVLMITKGGVLYMTSEAFNTKGEAKNQITMAIVGFLLAISSVLILTTINPELLNFKLLVRPLTFELPPTGIILAGDGERGCINSVDRKIMRCVWAVRGLNQTRCDEAVVSKFGPEGSLNFVNLPLESCKTEKSSVENICCGFISQNNGCSGFGVKEGKEKCLWAGLTLLSDGCATEGFQEAHPGFTKDSDRLFCAGTRPAGGVFSGTSDCCAK